MSGPTSSQVHVESPEWDIAKFAIDAATSDDSMPRLPVDALMAVDAVNSAWADASTSEQGNREVGYPSQGGVAKIFKALQFKQIVYCVVTAPMEEDLQGDFMSAEEIEKTAHNYLIKSRVVGATHAKPMDAQVVESYIAPQDLEFTGQYGTQKVKQGSWILGIKVSDPKEWQKVLSGEYTGFSVGGFGLRDLASSDTME